MRAALLSYSARAGDAIGNHVAEKLSFFLDHGADVRVFVEDDRHLHPAVQGYCHRLPSPDTRGDAWDFITAADLVVVDYGQYYRLLGLLPALDRAKPRILFDYHGVTPPEMWPVQNREPLEQGAHRRGLVWSADAAVVHSRFAEKELTAGTGYPTSRVFRLGYAVDTEALAPPVGTDGVGSLKPKLQIDPAAKLLLFVGRFAPNKRASLLVEAVARLTDLPTPVHAALVGDDSDLYRDEAEACQDRAEQLGVLDRVHLLGRLDAAGLVEAYRSADVFVMPSKHEAFCLPVVEAMAAGLPVVAARAAALPETVGDAGLTFLPDDPDDLCRQIRRVLTDTTAESPRLVEGQTFRVAVVAFRFGPGFAGGAETSLRTMALALRHAGHAVEVFSTCTTAEHDWTSASLPEQSQTVDGLTVHRFRIDPHDRAKHLESVRLINLAEGPVPADLEQTYLRHSIHSSALVERLVARAAEFDAVLVGPYLFGLTYAVATAVPGKTLLVPCFHDEPFARLPRLLAAYERVGGVLYHTPEEQQFAEATLGFNHPGGRCVGTLIETAQPGDPARAVGRVNTDLPYVVYAGRYSQYKELLTLLTWARRYDQEHPNRVRFVFLGHGELTIPNEPWAIDLGFVDEACKRDVIAGAAAVAQLSRLESLSLVTLEAWAQGVPVIVNRRSEVLAGHLDRCHGGHAVEDYEGFATALDGLVVDRPAWAAAGERGKEYVRREYGCPESFTSRLTAAVSELSVPLAGRMRRRGLDRAHGCSRAVWREEFGRAVEAILDAPPRHHHTAVEVRPRVENRTVPSGANRLVVPVRIINRGSTLVAPDGPGRSVIRSRVVDESGRLVPGAGIDTPLPALLLPERSLAAAVAVAVPAIPGKYAVRLTVEPVTEGTPESSPGVGEIGPTAAGRTDLTFVVHEGEPAPAPPLCAPMLDSVQLALAHAERRQRLPDGYQDVSTGWLAGLKRWVKRKLLGNFQRGYVDVLARQQSSFNQQVLVALAELTDCCATLNHAARETTPAEDPSLTQLKRSLADARRVLTDLEARLARLEAGSWTKEEVHS